MANRVLVNEDSLVDIAAAIKEKSGDYEASYTPGEMGNAIRTLSVGGGSNLYVDGFSILQDDDGRIYTAIGGGYGEIEGEPGPMVIYECGDKDGKLDSSDNWIKLTIDEGSIKDMININQTLVINIRDYHLYNDINDYYYKNMHLDSWNEDWVEYFFDDTWAYERVRFVNNEAWIKPSFDRTTDSEYNGIYQLTGFSLYVSEEKMISSGALNEKANEMDNQLLFTIGETPLIDILGTDGGDILYLDLQNSFGEQSSMNLVLDLYGYEEYHDKYMEFGFDGSYDWLGYFSGNVYVSSNSVSISVSDPRAFNEGYTLVGAHFHKARKGDPVIEEGPIPIGMEFIPVDNDTIIYDWDRRCLVAPVSGVQEWRVEEMINEALANSGGSGISEERVQEMIDATLGGIENGSY